MNILKYETPSEDFKKYDGPIIFLAGPTVRGHQLHLTSWRGAACEEFRKQGFDGTLILPEFEDKTESDQYRYDLPEWEFAGLQIADVIMFWVPRTRELIGLTTNFEMGYWIARFQGKLVYGRPDDAYRMKYCDIMWNAESRRLREYELPIFNTLEDTVKESITLSRLIK